MAPRVPAGGNAPWPSSLSRRTFGLSAALLASGCSAVQVVNAIAPQHMVAHDLRYAEGPRHTLDVFAPEAPGPHPTVVFIYGGEWEDGNKAMYRFVGDSLAANGRVVVIPDYRLYPEVRYPDFLQDCAQAVAWAFANVARFGGDPTRLFLVGHSAGAYNVAMLNLDARWLEAFGLSPTRLRGAVGLAGPYDFLPLKSETLIAIFSGADRIDTQPITYVTGHAPPMLLLAGSADTTVLPKNTTHLAERIRGAGGYALDRIYPGINHVEIIGAFSGPLQFLCPSLRDTLAFTDVTA